eukprot:jgi/Psemu1/26687/gm1.26687_g
MTVIYQTDEHNRFYCCFVATPITNVKYFGKITPPVFVGNCFNYKEPSYDGVCFVLVTKTCYGDTIPLVCYKSAFSLPLLLEAIRFDSQSLLSMPRSSIKTLNHNLSSAGTATSLTTDYSDGYALPIKFAGDFQDYAVFKAGCTPDPTTCPSKFYHLLITRRRRRRRAKQTSLDFVLMANFISQAELIKVLKNGKEALVLLCPKSTVENPSTSRKKLMIYTLTIKIQLMVLSDSSARWKRPPISEVVNPNYQSLNDILPGQYIVYPISRIAEKNSCSPDSETFHPKSVPVQKTFFLCPKVVICHFPTAIQTQVMKKKINLNANVKYNAFTSQKSYQIGSSTMAQFLECGDYSNDKSNAEHHSPVISSTQKTSVDGLDPEMNLSQDSIYS